MEILSFDQLPSTQRYLQDAIAQKRLQAPVAVIAREQTAGIGSRDNSWIGEEGNFFASIAVDTAMLPEDLPLASASIYFSFIMKKVLRDLGQEVWLKWPNDFYLKEHKVGGTITHKVGETLICGMGINLAKAPQGYASIGCDIAPMRLLRRYLEVVEDFPQWKQIFSEYKIEFELSRAFSTHTQSDEKVGLRDAVLCHDGSILLQGRKVYSLR